MVPDLSARLWSQRLFLTCTGESIRIKHSELEELTELMELPWSMQVCGVI